MEPHQDHDQRNIHAKTSALDQTGEAIITDNNSNENQLEQEKTIVMRSAQIAELFGATKNKVATKLAATATVASPSHLRAVPRRFCDFVSTTTKSCGLHRLKKSTCDPSLGLWRKKNKRRDWCANQQRLSQAKATFEYHGEDANAMSSYYHVVSDGVSKSGFLRKSSSTAEDDATTKRERVSSAILSQQLVQCVARQLEQATQDNTDSIDSAVFKQNVLDGIALACENCATYANYRLAATLNVCLLDCEINRLHVFSLGDSKTIVVRNGIIVYESFAVLREFNVPCVVAIGGPKLRTCEYVVQTFHLKPKDYVLTFSDGLGDNLFKEDIVEIIHNADQDQDQQKLQTICDQLVDKASRKPNSSTLFNREEPHLLAVGCNDINLQRVHEDEPLQVTTLRGPNSCSTRLESVAAERAVQPDEQNSFPFAHAAAMEYRKRTQSDPIGMSMKQLKDFSSPSKQLLNRQLLVRAATYATDHASPSMSASSLADSLKWQYSLGQLRQIAEMQTTKNDDITVLLTQI